MTSNVNVYMTILHCSNHTPQIEFDPIFINLNYQLLEQSIQLPDYILLILHLNDFKQFNDICVYI